MNIIKTSDLTREYVKKLFYDLPEIMEEMHGKTMATLFLEPSTRTRLSFEVAMQSLGGKVVSVSSEGTTSVTKGESLPDTVKSISQYVDLIAIRSSGIGDANIAGLYSDCPVINAGSGYGEHPTQALTDLYTIYKEKGTYTGLKILVSGDFMWGRAAKSFIRLAALFDNEIWMDSHSNLRIAGESSPKWNQCAWTKVSPAPPAIEIAKQADVIYMSRIQQDRDSGLNHLPPSFRITPEVMESLREDAIIMHPLPRKSEIDPAVDKDPRAVYFKQAKYGLEIRRKLIWEMIG